MSLISHVPQARVDALRADPEQSRRLSVNTTGSLQFLNLGTHKKAGAIADVRVRQAVNYARQGQSAAGRGRLPQGADPGLCDLSSGRLAAGRKPIEESLKKAGINLKVTTNKPWGPHFEALGNPAKRLEHQLAQNGWIPDYPGDNARQTIVWQYDSRLTDFGANFSEYHNPTVNRLIDQALAEADPHRRAALWGQIDQQIMRDAPLVPLLWEKAAFQWASRVHGWVYHPWTVGPDLTAVWLDPPIP